MGKPAKKAVKAKSKVKAKKDKAQAAPKPKKLKVRAAVEDGGYIVSSDRLDEIIEPPM